jgi:ferritin-like metal-binding protein YciE
VQTLRELFEHDLQAVVALERGLAAALQDMAEESAKKDVRQAFLRQQRQTLRRLKRLDRVAARPEGEPAPSPVVEGVLRAKERFVAAAPADQLLDYYSLQLAARLLHYAVAAHEGLVETAERLQLKRVVPVLRANLEEERAALSDLAALTREFHVTFRQAGGLLQPVPPAQKQRAQTLVGG